MLGKSGKMKIAQMATKTGGKYECLVDSFPADIRTSEGTLDIEKPSKKGLNNE